jgi:hypothetical protein
VVGSCYSEDGQLHERLGAYDSSQASMGDLKVEGHFQDPRSISLLLFSTMLSSSCRMHIVAPVVLTLY